jgi:hypothetical protein
MLLRFLTALAFRGISGITPEGVKVNRRARAGTAAAGESFRTVRAASFDEVLRGVSFTPGSRIRWVCDTFVGVLGSARLAR